MAKYVRSRLRVRRWGAPAEDAALLARFEAAKAELGVKDLALLVCPAVGAPLVTGFVNPALLLPRETVSDGVLRHELIHTRRRDLWYKSAPAALPLPPLVQPLVHWMAAAASRDLERSCDEAAVAGRDAAFRAAYGAAMLDAVEEGIEARAP
ncbi:MAG: M56 family metallopeptidase [Flavonifractor plautii]